MAIWDNFFKSQNSPAQSGEDNGAGNAVYNDSSLLGVYSPLTYQECKDIYVHWPLGKRVASSLPNFAMSAGRKFNFKDCPPLCSDLFVKSLERFDIDSLVKSVAIQSRVYGLAALFVGVKDSKLKFEEDVDFTELNPENIYFNVLDPLALAGIQIGQDPRLASFQRVSQAFVGGEEVSLTRICPVFSDTPLYLKWSNSAYSWSAPSVYQNMSNLIKSWNRCVVALERLATKAGSIVFKNRDGGVVNSIVVRAASFALEQIRNLQNDGACSIDKDANVEFFNLSGASDVTAIIDEMNKLIMLALADTPSAILLDSKLAQGFSDGGEDMKALLMAVDTFRVRILTPLYNFVDQYLLRVTFTDEVLQDILLEYADDFKGLDVPQLREMILGGYSFEWGELYPEPESVKLETQSKKLDNIKQLKELGVNKSDIEQLLNESNIFASEIELLDEAEEGFGEEDEAIEGEGNDAVERGEATESLVAGADLLYNSGNNKKVEK